MEHSTPPTGWNIGTLASGAIAYLNVVYHITGTGTITNTATATTTSTDPNNNNDASTAPLNIPNPGADIGVVKSFQDISWNTITTANLGDLIYSTIQVINNGPSTATGILINDPTPTGLTYADTYYSTIGTFNPATGWNIGTLASGAIAYLNVVYHITGTGTITNTATATTTSTDPNNNNDASTAPLNIPNPGADIGVVKSFQDISWNTITTANLGDVI